MFHVERPYPPHGNVPVGPDFPGDQIPDEAVTWRLIYRLDDDAVVIVDVFSKKTARIPGRVIARCQDRLRRYDAVNRES